MTGTAAIKNALESTAGLLAWYVSDLSDEDLKVRPVAGANNTAWQLAHLIEAEPFLGGDVPGASYPPIPDKVKAPRDGSDPPGGYLSKAEYLEALQKMRSATVANLQRLSDADLDKPNTGRMAKQAPTIGALLLLLSNHTLMHVGQFTVVRRALKKPVLF
jgi:hypothetical protein